jgi:hypothetical protein
LGQAARTIRKTKHRGIESRCASFLLNLIAYSLIRINRGPV